MKLDRLLDAIRRVHAGEKYVPPELAVRMSERIFTQLSEREKEVLKLIAKGRLNKEIGAALGVTEGTVKVHVTSILSKLEVTARTEALVVAVRHGLIDIEQIGIPRLQRCRRNRARPLRTFPVTPRLIYSCRSKHFDRASGGKRPSIIPP